jgi:methylated-DNA-protein-cysteine methyltransferase-like protein
LPRGDAARQRILAAVRALPAGQVASYGQVAANAGLKGRARLVGRVLREAGDADLPWHRVLRADGSIAFPRGSKAYREQARRLAREDVIVRAGRVRLADFAWEQSLDAALWGAPPSPRKPRVTRA